MTSPGSPSQARSLIIERLVGDSGEAAHVIGTGRSMGERALPLLQKSLAGELGAPVTVDLRAVEVSRVPRCAARMPAIAFAMTIIASPTSSRCDDPGDRCAGRSRSWSARCLAAIRIMPVSPIERDLSQIETRCGDHGVPGGRAGAERIGPALARTAAAGAAGDFGQRSQAPRAARWRGGAHRSSASRRRPTAARSRVMIPQRILLATPRYRRWPRQRRHDRRLAGTLFAKR